MVFLLNTELKQLKVLSVVTVRVIWHLLLLRLLAGIERASCSPKLLAGIERTS